MIRLSSQSQITIENECGEDDGFSSPPRPWSVVRVCACARGPAPTPSSRGASAWTPMIGWDGEKSLHLWMFSLAHFPSSSRWLAYQPLTSLWKLGLKLQELSALALPSEFGLHWDRKYNKVSFVSNSCWFLVHTQEKSRLAYADGMGGTPTAH